jgi:ribose 5-phosphate isomerase A
MKTDSRIIREFHWADAISNLDAKRRVAAKVAALLRDGDVVGVGSGSTSFVALQAVAERAKAENLHCCAVPTSHEMTMACASVGLPVTSLWENTPDWCFDGADEVDPARNLVKGRGGAMFREKLVMRAAARSYILIDESKRVDRLGQKFAVPVEVLPAALAQAEKALASLGAGEIILRLAKKKDGPVITEQGNFILDVRFTEIGASLEREIKSITGVLESGLFWGFPVEILLS